jgi:hypothetical protein
VRREFISKIITRIMNSHTLGIIVKFFGINYIIILIINIKRIRSHFDIKVNNISDKIIIFKVFSRALY